MTDEQEMHDNDHKWERTVVTNIVIEEKFKDTPCGICGKMVRSKCIEASSTKSGFLSGLHVYHVQIWELKDD